MCISSCYLFFVLTSESDSRHIELDGDEHGQLANRLLEFLCAGDSAKIAEAEANAARYLRSRIALRDEICADIKRLPEKFSVVSN